VGWVRLTHPFPSTLDGIVSGGVALVAGATVDVALRIGIAMTLLQLGIGTVNDVVDAPADEGRKPGKPIPEGLVAPRSARIAAVVLFAAGFVLAGTLGPPMLALSVVVVTIGLAYDLRLKGTAWSWLPFAVGIPILPVYGWLGAREVLPPAFALLVPAAVVAGTALATGNALVDIERDRAAGADSIATRLGSRGATRQIVLSLSAVAGMAISSAGAVGAPALVLLALGGTSAVPIVAAVLAAGRSPGTREWAWRIEAVGLAILAGIWLRVVLA
jgi:4-hydroxybenzoate polyprenyltransferase